MAKPPGITEKRLLRNSRKTGRPAPLLFLRSSFPVWRRERSRPFALLGVLQTAGLIAGGWYLWSHSLIPLRGTEYLYRLATEAVIYTMLAWMFGSAVTFGLYYLVALADMPEAVIYSLRASAPAMWFAPAIVLMTTPVPAALVVSLILIANAARMLITRWVAISPAIPEPAPAPVIGMFRPFAEQAWLTRGWAIVLMASFTLQVGVVAKLWRDPFLGAFCLAVSAAILTSLAITREAYQPERPPALPPSALSIGATFLVMASLSFGGLAVGHGRLGGGDSAAPSGPPGAMPDASIPASQPSNGAMGGDFPGVILLPEMQSHVTLVAPVTSYLSPSTPASPVGIPFAGEYWLFRPPRTRPPAWSYIRRGKPSEISFHTTDGWPMTMEAHQTLERPVDVRCCRQIQVNILSDDAYIGTVSLELVLTDRAAGIAVSLGSQPVPARFASEQTLAFPMAADARLHQFDEFRVIFHCEKLRADKSARIAIERFLLTP